MTEVASVFQNFEICRLIFSNRLPSGRVWHADRVDLSIAGECNILRLVPTSCTGFFQLSSSSIGVYHDVRSVVQKQWSDPSILVDDVEVPYLSHVVIIPFANYTIGLVIR